MSAKKIVIIGAGPAGIAAALFLAKAGISSTILEKEKFPRDKICGDALSGKTVAILKKLDPNYLSELGAETATFIPSYGVIFVAPNQKSLRIPFKKDKENLPHAPGFISKRIYFDNWLMEKAKANPLITVLENHACRKYEYQNEQFICETETENFPADLVIAADGAYSNFAKEVGGIATEAAHNCFGLRAYFENVQGMDAENFIELHFLKEFLPGYFWIFPLPNGGANVGVGMRADKLKKKKINLKKSFEEILKSSPSLQKRFENATQMGEIKLWGLPLGSKKRKLSGANYLLAGDAAMLIDPFTGEGIGNALMSGYLAAQTAVEAIQKNDFSADFLQHYNEACNQKLASELKLSYRMQQLVEYPWLFDLVVNKAHKNPVLQETISCMFEDLDMRAKLKDPRFYWRLWRGK